MNTPTKKPFRKRHLFARSVDDVVKNATKPLMNKQGKLYGALLQHWPQIVGPTRATITRPERLQFPTTQATQGAILHLSVRPAHAPELTYELDAMLEQCARYFGYRAIERIVLHPSHDLIPNESAPSTPKSTAREAESLALPQDVPREMEDVFRRLAAHVASAKDNKK